MRTANPALNAESFAGAYGGALAMTIEGTALKTLVLLAILVATGAFTWVQTVGGFDATTNVVREANRVHSISGVPGYVWGYVLVGSLGGLIVALVTTFKKEWSPVTAPLYAGLEGVALGAYSAVFEYMYSGIVLQAVTLTVATLAALLLAYSSGIVRATENFKLGVVAATGAVAIVYVVDICARAFFGVNVPFIHETGMVGIGVSGVIVVIAALNLVLDFDFIEKGAEQGAPKYMEWYGGFGLLVTLVWMYLEMLRLLAKIKSND